MKKENQMLIKIDNAINGGKDQAGNVIKVPVFDSVSVVNGELYGVISEYIYPIPEFEGAENDGTIRKIYH